MALVSGLRMMVFAIALLAGGNSALAGASSCRSALLPPPTQEQVAMTLDALAVLTLEIDLLKPQGTETLSSLKSDLKLKQEEVMTALNMNRAELRDRLSPRIQELQNGNKKSLEKKSRSRQAQKKNLVPVPFYYKTQDTQAPRMRVQQVLSAKLPEITYVVNSDGYIALYTHNLANRLGEWMSTDLLVANINASKKNIYSISRDFNILKFKPGVIDPVSPAIKIKDVNNQPWKNIDPWTNIQLEISPKEKFLALHISDVSGELYIIRIADGEVVHHQATGDRFQVKFRSDEEIFIADGTSIVKRNFTTQQEVKIEVLTPEATLQRLWMDPKGKNLVHASNAKITTLDPRTLKVKSSQDLTQETHSQLQMPNSDRFFLAYKDRLPELFDYTEKRQISLFSFEEIRVLNTAFSDDGKNVLFFYMDNSGDRLSIWTREN